MDFHDVRTEPKSFLFFLSLNPHIKFDTVMLQLIRSSVIRLVSTLKKAVKQIHD